MDNLNAFLSPTITTNHENHTNGYADSTIDQALRYASNDSSVGAAEMRKMAKITKMMADPDMEEHLAHMTKTFCEVMFNVLQLIKGVGAHNAMQGMLLIATARDLFSMGLIVSRDCPVQELFTTQYERLTALNNASAWAEEYGQDSWLGDDGLVRKQGKESRRVPRLDSDSDGSMDKESEWLKSVAAKKHQTDNAGKVPPQPKAQSTMALWYGNGVKKTTVKVRLPDGSTRQQLVGSSVLVLPKMVGSSSPFPKREWHCSKGCGMVISHGPGRKAHEKICTWKPPVTYIEADEEASDAADEAADGEADGGADADGGNAGGAYNGGHADDEADDGWVTLGAGMMGGELGTQSAVPLPYPNDPPPSEGSNTAAHDAVRTDLGIDSSTPVEQVDALLRANPVVLHRLAVTSGLYAVYETVAARARELAATVPFPQVEPANTNAGSSGGRAIKRRKTLRKDGQAKQSRGNAKRTPRTIFFKYEVAQYYRRMKKLKSQGLCDAPGDATVERFGSGITNGQVSTWAKSEDQLREALLHRNVVKGRGKRAESEKLVPFTSRAARRCMLRTRTIRPFAAAEAEVHAIYREKRDKGLPTTGHYLRVTMKKTLRKHYGSDAADSFKASRCWLSGFTRYFEMSLRRKTNKKHMSVEERLPKCKRWHARFRRRLGAGPPGKLHLKWGRWLPEDRLSGDQVPFNLREGGGMTYEDVGAERVWVVGSKTDCGKRFGTLMVTARCANGDPKKPRRGQPKLTIAFRGQGV